MLDESYSLTMHPGLMSMVTGDYLIRSSLESGWSAALPPSCCIILNAESEAMQALHADSSLGWSKDRNQSLMKIIDKVSHPDAVCHRSPRINAFLLNS